MPSFRAVLSAKDSTASKDDESSLLERLAFPFPPPVPFPGLPDLGLVDISLIRDLAIPLMEQQGSEVLTEALATQFKALPFSVNAAMRVEVGTIWMGLDQNRMTIPPGILLFSHGLVVPGRWNVIGIVDAVPHPEEAGPSAAELGFGQLAAEIGDSLNTMREAIGRPDTAFALTPLAIMRDVGSADG